MENETNKNNFLKKLFIIIPMVIIITIAGALIYESGFSLEVNFNDKVIAYVKDSDVVDTALATVENEVKETYGEKAYFEKEVKLNKVRKHNDDLVFATDLSHKIASNIEIYKPAAVIHVDKKEVLVVEDQKVANELLDNIKKPFEESDEDQKVLSVNFVQKVEIVEEDRLVEEIVSERQTLQPFQIKGAKPQKAQLINQEPTAEIQRLDSSEDKKVEANLPKKINENAAVAKALQLDVEKTVEIKEVEEVDFKTKTETSSSMYKGQSKVKQKGQKGEKEVTKEIVFINDEEKSSEVTLEKTVKEPVDKIVVKGSKKRVYATPSYNGGSSSSVVSLAYRQVNNRVPYVYGGASPAGFDCSGLTKYLFANSGVYLPHSSQGQMNYGSPVSKSNLRAGDLVFFTLGSGSSVGHVGLYIGNGQMIHAPVPGRNVEVASIYSSYFARNYVGARRIL